MTINKTYADERGSGTDKHAQDARTQVGIGQLVSVHNCALFGDFDHLVFAQEENHICARIRFGHYLRLVSIKKKNGLSV